MKKESREKERSESNKNTHLGGKRKRENEKEKKKYLGHTFSMLTRKKEGHVHRAERKGGLPASFAENCGLRGGKDS